MTDVAMSETRANRPVWTPLRFGAPADPPPREPPPRPALQHLSIGRDCLVEQLTQVFARALTSDARRVELLWGPRGIGKTHVLERLAPKLRERVGGDAHVAALPERLHPTSLVQLLARVLAALPDDPELGPSGEALRSLQQHEGDRESRALELIRARLRGRPLLLLLEHLDELVDALGAKGRVRLLELLEREPSWSLLGTARAPVELVPLDLELRRLPELDPEQCRELLAAHAQARGRDKLASALEGPSGLARAQALHHLMGGNPWAMSLLARALDDERQVQLERALPRLARELAPSLRERCARVSPSQRLLVELLSESWRPLTVTELAERSFTKQSSVSGALRHLRREGLVRALEVGRERYYELARPLERLARPHAGLLAFAEVLRRFYAGGLERPPLEPEPELAADPDSQALFDEARAILAASSVIAVGRLRGRLASSKSPIMSAALALALEQNGADAEALRVLLSVPPVQAHQTHAALLSLATEPSGSAELIVLTLEAQTQADDPEARARLLHTLSKASGARRRALCELMLSYPLVRRWLEAEAYADLGRLLGTWHPPRSTPELERQLSAAVELCWHRGRLAQLLPPSASLDGLLAVVSPSVRRLLAHASVLGLSAKTESEELDAELRRRLGGSVQTAPWPSESLALDPTLSPVLLDSLCRDALREAWAPSPDLARAVVGAGLYAWIASRRPLEPLARLLERLGHEPGDSRLPYALLDSGTPREALARLSASERDLVRVLLQRCGDLDALEHFPRLNEP